MEVTATPPETAPWPRGSRRADAVICALLCAAGTLLARAEWRERAGRALIHDEQAYLFQARTLLSGHLCAPSPPLPEFFETPHLLVVPTFCSKYYPGHALAIAPLLALGVPWLWSCLSIGAAAALLFLAARLSRAGRVAALAGALLFLGSGESLRFWATYLSHGTSGLCVAAALAVAARFWWRPSARLAAALAACAGYALLTRPFVGLALAAAGGLAILCKNWRLLPAYAAPLGVALLCGLCANHAATGSFTTTPWQLYARQYTPGDGPGFGPRTTPREAPLREMPPHLQPMREQYLSSRESYTLQALPGVARRRALQILLDYPPSALAVPFAVAGLFAPAGALLVPLTFAGLFFPLQLLFHGRNSFYLCELWPALALLSGLGLDQLLRGIGRLRRERVRLALAAALAVPWLLIAWSAQDELRGSMQYGATEALYLGRVDRALAAARRARALIFLRYPPGWLGMDLTINEPDLQRAQTVRALDLGARNAELRRLFPDRPAWLFDLATLRAWPL